MHFTNLLSSLFQKFFCHEFPAPIQKALNLAYAKLFRLDMSEFESAESYESLCELFSRRLVTPRVIDEHDDIIIYPCDGKVLLTGEVGVGIKVKGFDYELKELLCEDWSSLQKMLAINIYLSPQNYHRFHAPLNLRIISAAYCPGRLYPVGRFWQSAITSLFAKNERVVLKCENESIGIFYMVIVGALNVGSIKLHFEPQVATNQKNAASRFEYEELFVKKGEELGFFSFGSSIVLLFEKDTIAELPSDMHQCRFGTPAAVISR